MPLIEFHNVSKVFGTRSRKAQSIRAVDNFSLSVNHGEIFCLIGENGAGKTTLVRLLLNFIRPTSGNINLFGKSNTDVAVKKFLGYLPENAYFPSHLTVRKFLSHWGRFSGLHGRKLEESVNLALHLLALEERKDSLIRELSKGMKLRVGIAQALVNDPQLLVLDEPNDGLDPVGRVAFRDTLRQLKSMGKTIFMNSHLLSEVEQISDRIGVMRDGRLLKVGQLEDFVLRGEEFTIKIDKPSDQKFSQLKDRFAVQVQGDSCLILARNTKELSEVTSMLAKMNVRVKSVQQSIQSLEETFISILREEP